MLILDHLRARVTERAAHVFLLHGDRAVSYAEIDAQSDQAARVLIEQGVRKGDRVTVAMGNSIEYVVALFGILKAGAVYNPVNARLGAGELSYILAHAEPRWIVTDPGNLEFLRAPEMKLPATAGLACFAERAGAAGGAFDFAAAVAAAASGPVGVQVTADDASSLLYTSGTTGQPKGVLALHRTTGAAGKHFLDTLGIRADDTILAVTPLFHGNAWGGLVTALQAGGTFAFPTGFRASEFWPLVESSGATVVYTLGTILAILLTQPVCEAERNNRLRVILGLGSAPIRDQVIARFGVEHVAECFGSTDAGVVTITPLGQAPRGGSAGPPVPGVQIVIRDDADNAVPTRSVGEITILSPHRMAEYFRDPEQTAAALRDGWFYTGDLGYLDEEGWLYFVDRKRDVIRRGGENMSSVLIEKTLREHPQVLDAAVIGIPDATLGQEVKAFLVVRGEVSVDELRQFAAARLAKFQVPRLWEFRDALPKTPTQRVEKYKLRQESGKSGPLLG